MNSKAQWTERLLMVAVGGVCLIYSLALSAQVQTQSSTTNHPPTVETTVESGEVVYVEGNGLIVKMQDGSLRDFTNIPESARVVVDGREVGIHDVKVGMKLERTITTTSTPKTITTVQTVSGKVWQVMPPSSVTLILDDGTTQQFKIPKDQKFNIDGQMVDAWGLKKGMKVSATKIVEVPEVHVTQEHKVTGSMLPPALPPPDKPILVALVVGPVIPAAPAAPAASEAAAASKPARLPKTASDVPLIGLLGLGSLAASLGLKTIRSISHKHIAG
jgi:hypothetical protein